MERNVRTTDLDNDLDQALRLLSSSDDRIVLTQDGEPVAVMLSMAEYRQWKRMVRHDLVSKIRENAERVNLPSEQAEALIAEAIGETRAVE